MVNLKLSDVQARLVADLVDWWLEDFEEATNDVEHDRMFKTPDDLLRAVSGMHEMFAEASDLREQLRGRAGAIPAL